MPTAQPYSSLNTELNVPARLPLLPEARGLVLRYGRLRDEMLISFKILNNGRKKVCSTRVSNALQPRPGWADRQSDSQTPQKP